MIAIAALSTVGVALVLLVEILTSGGGRHRGQAPWPSSRQQLH